jgi:hypothetical protein
MLITLPVVSCVEDCNVKSENKLRHSNSELYGEYNPLWQDFQTEIDKIFETTKKKNDFYKYCILDFDTIHSNYLI